MWEYKTYKGLKIFDDYDNDTGMFRCYCEITLPSGKRLEIDSKYSHRSDYEAYESHCDEVIEKIDKFINLQTNSHPVFYKDADKHFCAGYWYYTTDYIYGIGWLQKKLANPCFSHSHSTQSVVIDSLEFYNDKFEQIDKNITEINRRTTVDALTTFGSITLNDIEYPFVIKYNLNNKNYFEISVKDDTQEFVADEIAKQLGLYVYKETALKLKEL